MEDDFRARAAKYVAGILGADPDRVEISQYSPGRLEFVFRAPWGDTFRGWTTWRRKEKNPPALTQGDNFIL